VKTFLPQPLICKDYSPRYPSSWESRASESVALQPLALIDDVAERAWAAEWIANILARETIVITPEAKDHLWSALTSLASAPVGERTLTGLSVLLMVIRLPGMYPSRIRNAAPDRAAKPEPTNHAVFFSMFAFEEWHFRPRDEVVPARPPTSSQ
jgi:hypothetical protein